MPSAGRREKKRKRKRGKAIGAIDDTDAVVEAGVDADANADAEADGSSHKLGNLSAFSPSLPPTPSREGGTVVQHFKGDGDTSNTGPVVDDEGNIQTRKRRKKSKNRKKKNCTKEESIKSERESRLKRSGAEGRRYDFGGEGGDDGDESPETLEGRMVSGKMVLVDRKARKVYSATERLSNGDLATIGRLEDGEIVLDAAAAEGTAHADFIEAPDSSLSEAAAGTGQADSAVLFPFRTDPDDHCESPLEAYNHIKQLLEMCGAGCNGSGSIYDPYYCNGSVVTQLASLGFPNVYNRNEDCYLVWESPQIYPKYDIFVTNPPYSGDHIERLIFHVTSKRFDKPWFLLMPQYVVKKEFYEAAITRAGLRPFYLVPKKRYVYKPPPSFRTAKRSDVHKKSSPFVSMWYIWGGTPQQNAQLIAAAQRIVTCQVACSKSALRDLRRKKHKT